MRTMAWLVAVLAAASACSSRGMDGPNPLPDGAVDAPPGDVKQPLDLPSDLPADLAPDLAVDATVDASPEASIDAPDDAPLDASVEAAADGAPDAAPDAAPDVALDASPDASSDVAPDAAMTRCTSDRECSALRLVCDRAAEWLGNSGFRNPDSGATRPWLCVVSVEAPHPPYDAPAAGVVARRPEELVLPANVPRGGEAEAKARKEEAERLEAQRKEQERKEAENPLLDQDLKKEAVDMPRQEAMAPSKEPMRHPV